MSLETNTAARMIFRKTNAGVGRHVAVTTAPIAIFPTAALF
jgi:hypothetical protein